MDETVAAVVAAARANDWATVRAHLHPYLHRYGVAGEVRGRNNVPELMTTDPPEPPASYELRDGQIYRRRSR